LLTTDDSSNLEGLKAYPAFELCLESSLALEVLAKFDISHKFLETYNCLRCDSNDVFDSNGSRRKRCSRMAALPRSKVLVFVIFHDLLKRLLFLNIHAITCLLFCTIPIIHHFDVRTRDHDLNGFASIDLGGALELRLLMLSDAVEVVEVLR